MAVLDQLRALRRRWPVVVALALAGAGAGLSLGGAPPAAAKVQVTHRLVLTTTSETARRAEADGQRLVGYALLATSDEVGARVAAALGVANAAPLTSRVQAVPNPGQGVLDIVVKDGDPARATAIADTFASTVVAVLADRAVADQQQQQAIVVARLNDLKNRTRALDQRIAAGDPDRSVLEAERDALIRQYGAEYEKFDRIVGGAPPASPLRTLASGRPTPVRDDAGLDLGGGLGPLVGLLAGLALGAAATIALDTLSPRITTRTDAERAFGLPVVAEVGLLPRRWRRRQEVIVWNRPVSLLADSYRRLRTSLMLMSVLRPAGASAPPGAADADPPEERPPAHFAAGDARRGDPRVIMVSSAGIGEGKTTTAANLAASFAEAGRSVLVLNFDFARPRVHIHLDAEPGPGLTEVLASGAEGRELADVIRPTNVPGVRIATSGRLVRPAGALVTRGSEIVARAKELADMVVIDSSPLLTTNEASELLHLVDAVVVTCRSGRTRPADAARVSELMARLGAPVLGVVLVAVPVSRSGRVYYREAMRAWRRQNGRWRRSPARPPSRPAGRGGRGRRRDLQRLN